MCGHLGEVSRRQFTGVLLTSSGNAWNIAFLVSAIIYGAGALCWMFIDPVTPIMPPDPNADPQIARQAIS
jgi:ACS family glucarate transporter-like MFS transporter